MPEQPPTPPDSPTPPDDAGGPSHGDFNQAQLESVRKTEGVARVAQKEAYNQRLIEEGMAAETPVALLAKCTGWRGLSGDAVTATTGKEKASGLGDDAATELHREVEYYRGKARLAINKQPQWKHAEIEAFKVRYFIGKDIFTSRALAGQSAADILKHAGTDNLPGVTPARLAASAKILTDFTTPKGEQSDAQSEATRLRALRDTAYAEIIRLRHEIQFAADTAWPWHNDLNIATRREFLLPAGRAFTG